MSRQADNSSGEHDHDYEPKDDIQTEPHKPSMSGRRRSSTTAADRVRQNLNAKLSNPLAGYSHAELQEMGEAYARKYQVGDQEDIDAFRIGAICAQDPARFDSVPGISDMDRDIMRREFTNRWSQPKLLYLVIVLCSTCAAVQGMGTLNPSLYLKPLLTCSR